MCKADLLLGIYCTTMDFKHPLPHAASHARNLRKRSTPAEEVLWEALRNRKLLGLKFRRQTPVGRFIVDFLCKNPPLIIELDGPIHEFRIQEDAERTTAIIDDHHIPILRLKNEEILENLPNALLKIEQVLLSHLTPNPSPSADALGERGALLRREQTSC